MSTVVSAPAAVNSASAPLAATWAALAYASGKESNRDALTDGAAHAVNLTITGDVDGEPVFEHVAGRLTIGHSSEKASSTTPNIAHIVGAILGKLNPTTREAILRDLPEEYAAGGQSLPELSVGLAAQAETLLSALRQTKRVTSRGPVKFAYSVATDFPEASLAVAGRIGG